MLHQRLRVVAMGVAGARACAAGVFPFGLGGQAVALAFGAAEPGGQMPGRRARSRSPPVLVGLGKAGVAPGVARQAALEGIAARGGGRVVGGL